jgi:hypothetical protein
MFPLVGIGGFRDICPILRFSVQMGAVRAGFRDI